MTPTHLDARVPSGMSDRHEQDKGYTALSYILAGFLLYGGLGWLGDKALHTSFLMPLGFMLGAVLSLYMVVKRFGGSHDAPAGKSAEENPSRGEESQ